MSFVSRMIGGAERIPLPDVVIRAAIQRMCSRTATRLASGSAESDACFADEMAARAIAEHNRRSQLPSIRKCRRPSSPRCSVRTANIRRASTRSRCRHCRRPRRKRCGRPSSTPILADGQSILELGSGWGSLALWMARQFPNSHITTVSNSHGQCGYIENAAMARGLKKPARHHGRHERVRAGAAIRSHRIGRNVRAHHELA